MLSCSLDWKQSVVKGNRRGSWAFKQQTYSYTLRELDYQNLSLKRLQGHAHAHGCHSMWKFEMLTQQKGRDINTKNRRARARHFLFRQEPLFVPSYAASLHFDMNLSHAMFNERDYTKCGLEKAALFCKHCSAVTLHWLIFVGLGHCTVPWQAINPPLVYPTDKLARDERLLTSLR